MTVEFRTDDMTVEFDAVTEVLPVVSDPQPAESSPAGPAGSSLPQAADGSFHPVFVDNSGRRVRRFRVAAYAIGVVCAVYMSLLVVTMWTGPINPVGLIPFVGSGKAGQGAAGSGVGKPPAPERTSAPLDAGRATGVAERTPGNDAGSAATGQRRAGVVAAPAGRGSQASSSPRTPAAPAAGGGPGASTGASGSASPAAPPAPGGAAVPSPQPNPSSPASAPVSPVPSTSGQPSSPTAGPSGPARAPAAPGTSAQPSEPAVQSPAARVAVPVEVGGVSVPVPPITVRLAR